MIDLYEIIFKTFDGLYTELLASKIINQENGSEPEYGQLDKTPFYEFKLV